MVVDSVLNFVAKYAELIGIFFASLFVFYLVRIFLLSRLKKLSKKTHNDIDDMIIDVIYKIGTLFYIITSLFISIQFVEVSKIFRDTVFYIFLITSTFYVVLGLNAIIDYTTNKITDKSGESQKGSLTRILGNILKVVVWVFAVVILLQNLGYNVSGLIAGLGVGGLAIAFALQKVLEDIFASFSIHFDKPFKEGDFIIVGNDMGVVKKIGIKTTRIESLWGQEIVISNRELTSSRINNYKKMEKRRIHSNFGVVYSTPTSKLKKINEVVRDIFDKIKLARLDRIHFKGFGQSSLDFEMAYYVDTGDYNKYMDVQQEINLALKERFEKEKIEFAYPTQTIFVNK